MTVRFAPLVAAASLLSFSGISIVINYQINSTETNWFIIPQWWIKGSLFFLSCRIAKEPICLLQQHVGWVLGKRSPVHQWACCRLFHKPWRLCGLSAACKKLQLRKDPGQCPQATKSCFQIPGGIQQTVPPFPQTPPQLCSDHISSSSERPCNPNRSSAHAAVCIFWV